MNDDREARVRRRALEIWERAGRQGAQEDYLEEATHEIDGEFEEGPAGPSPADVPRPLIP